MLSPQLDLYRNVRGLAEAEGRELRVLDVGCGTGFSTLQLYRPGWETVGVDVDADLLRFASDMVGHVVELREANLEEGTSSFKGDWDVVTCIEVLEHLGTPRPFFDNLASLVAAGGHLVVSVPNVNSQVRKNTGHTKRGWRFAELAELASSVLGADRWYITDFELAEKLPPDTTVTPLVLRWDGPAG
jgi:2-polyprenyl-3-methyl-5-hydroxy-6-metoxy-1,4-benzoquinol methylase